MVWKPEQNRTGLAGTSASTPVVAGVIARLNAARSAQGKARLGWLNPWIYQNPHMLNDVATGKQACPTGGAYLRGCAR